MLITALQSRCEPDTVRTNNGIRLIAKSSAKTWPEGLRAHFLSITQRPAVRTSYEEVWREMQFSLSHLSRALVCASFSSATAKWLLRIRRKNYSSCERRFSAREVYAVANLALRVSR